MHSLKITENLRVICCHSGSAFFYVLNPTRMKCSTMMELAKPSLNSTHLGYKEKSATFMKPNYK